MAKSANTSLTNLRDYDAYLFDWDGTLGQSHDLWLDFYRTWLKRFNTTYSDEQIVKHIFGRASTGFRELGATTTDIEELEAATIQTAKQHMALAPLYPQAAEALQLLAAKGKKLGLVTALFREVIDLAVAHHELAKLFSVIVAGSEVTAQKPDPQGILLALDTLHMTPSRALMIGDSPKDLQAGQNAATHTLLFYPPEHETQHPPAEVYACKPTYTVRSWQEFISRL